MMLWKMLDVTAAGRGFPIQARVLHYTDGQYCPLEKVSAILNSIVHFSRFKAASFMKHQ
jgi:hypothetical protein